MYSTAEGGLETLSFAYLSMYEDLKVGAVGGGGWHDEWA